MDFIVGFPKVGNKLVIMVVVDMISKYAHFCSLPHQFSLTMVAQVFLDQVFNLHGMPTSIVFDRNPTLISKFWKELFKLQGTQLKIRTSYYPQIDVQIEVVNKFLETYLCFFASKKKHQWFQWLPLAECGTIQHTMRQLK